MSIEYIWINLSLQLYLNLEFDSHDDTYDYFNFYVKIIKIGVKIKNSFSKKNNNEKVGIVYVVIIKGINKENNAI